MLVETTPMITVLVKVAGQHTESAVIHRAGGCPNARRVRTDEWQRQDVDEREWRDSARRVRGWR